MRTPRRFVETQVYPEPHDHAEVYGLAFVHALWTDSERLTCRTPWAAPRCLCGYFTLAWEAVRPAELAQMQHDRQTEPSC